MRDFGPVGSSTTAGAACAWALARMTMSIGFSNGASIIGRAESFESNCCGRAALWFRALVVMSFRGVDVLDRFCSSSSVAFAFVIAGSGGTGGVADDLRPPPLRGAPVVLLRCLRGDGLFVGEDGGSLGAIVCSGSKI